MLILLAVLAVVGWLCLFSYGPENPAYQRTVINWGVGALLAVGSLLVILAGLLGTLSAQHWNSSAGWYPQEAASEAANFRGFGLLCFIAGATERVVLVIRGQASAASQGDAVRSSEA